MERVEVNEQIVNGGIGGRGDDPWSHHTGNSQEKLKPWEEN